MERPSLTHHRRTALLITCGNMDEKQLQAGRINIPKSSPPLPSDNLAHARIFVSYGEAVLWTFPLVECRTWFVRLSLDISHDPLGLHARQEAVADIIAA